MKYPGCNKYAYDADQIRRKPQAEIDLQDGQVEMDVPEIEYLICLCQIRHNAGQAYTSQYLPEDAPDQCSGYQKQYQHPKSV